MNGLIIYGDGRFSALSAAFGGEIDGDCDLSAEIVCVDEEEIRRLNRELRGVDAVTDVLSFPALDGIFGRRIEKKNFPFDCDEQGNLFGQVCPLYAILWFLLCIPVMPLGRMLRNRLSPPPFVRQIAG